MLVMLVGGPLEAGEPQDMHMEEANGSGREGIPEEVLAMSAAECSAIARLLLNLMLEMFGAIHTSSSLWLCLHISLWLNRGCCESWTYR